MDPCLRPTGVPVALGSDFNPNAHCMSMPMVMNMACVNMRMTMKEALVAATINAAGTVLLISLLLECIVGWY
jgi:imidazolonepropionase